MKNTCLISEPIGDEKNRTHKKVLAFITNPLQEGVGIFFHKKEKIEKYVIKDITYEKTIELGKSTYCFKFVPYGYDLQFPNGDRRIISSETEKDLMSLDDYISIVK